MREFGIGQSLVRTEDARLLRGLGRYTDDLDPPRRLAHLYIVRSPHPAARIVTIDRAAAVQSPGVIAILCGDDLAADGLGASTGAAALSTRLRVKVEFEPPWPALAIGQTRFVGDAVAAIVAETLAAAKDAADLLVVDYEQIDCVTAT